MAKDRTEGASKVTPFQPSVIERVAGALAGAVRYMKTGDAAASWFGPNKPLPPVAPEEVKGRRFDLPVGVNLNYKPRSEASETGITFEVLRRAADPAQGGWDFLRLAIETRKDQMEAQRWVIRGRNGEDGGDRAKAMEAALRRPDLVHTFRQWQRMLLEDLLVLDAPAIYCRPLKEGFRIPEVMDGATIKILSDPNGRTPLPPEAAYQQIIKGLPANDYTLEDLLYSPRNLRSNRFYGMSPVEQCLNIINLGLKRQLHQIAYYTEGNVPEQLVGVPEAWNPDQIKAVQEWMDALMSGNVEARRKLLFVPGGMQPVPLKDPKLQDPLDEWLVRVVCWCFSLSPQALVKEMNRATAQQGNETARLEGLEPLKEWWRDVMNELLVRCWGAEDLEFAWADEEITDPKMKAEVLVSLVQGKIITADEARDDLGRKPLTPEQKDELNPPPPPGLGGDETGQPGGGKAPATPGEPQGRTRDSASGSAPSSDAGKVQKKKSVKAIKRDRPAVRRAVKAIKKGAAAYLASIRDAVLADLRGAAKVHKVDMPPVSKEERERLQRMFEEELGAMAEDGAEAALNQVALLFPPDADKDLEAMLAQSNEQAIEWAAEHAAELVTAIDDTTRDRLADLTTRALEEGWSNDELAAQIEDGDLFSESRAEMIARTETAFADVQGNLAGWKETGVVESVQWVVAQDEFCEDCHSLNGQVVPLDGGIFTAESGETTDGPPLHPNCFLPGTVVSAAGVTGQHERWFEGEIVRLFIDGEDPLSVTPNHPILTRRGWVPAGEIQEGEDVFRVLDQGAFVRACDPEDHHVQACIEEMADSLLMAGGMASVSVPTTAEHFHGDGTPGQQVRIVRANGSLDGAIHTTPAKNAVQANLTLTDSDLERFAGGRYAGSVFEAVGLPTDGIMGLCGPGGTSGRPSAGGLGTVGLAIIPDGEEEFSPCLTKGAAVAPQRVRDIHAALSGLVSPVKVQKLVRGEKWSGHVYNLETKGGWYVAGSIIAHNCRCDLLPVLSTPEEE